jgi:surfeit locus 1 family protein
MRVSIGNRVFAPRPAAALLAAACVASFVALGNWQLGRAQEKRALIESFEDGARATVELGSGVVDGMPRYQHVLVAGRYDTARQVLLDNMPSSTGQAGYRVLTPLQRPGSSRLLLVDRGWVPLGSSRAVLPRVETAGGDRTVAGRLDQLPVPGVRMGAAAAPGEAGWPRVLNFPRQADLEQAFGQPVESRILLLDAALPDGYERVWRPSLGFPPERHLGYAMQWFALACVAVVGFVALSLQSTPSGPDSSP